MPFTLALASLRGVSASPLHCRGVKLAKSEGHAFFIIQCIPVYRIYVLLHTLPFTVAARVSKVLYRYYTGRQGIIVF